MIRCEEWAIALKQSSPHNTTPLCYIHGFLGARRYCPFTECAYPIEIPGHADTPISHNLTFTDYIDQLRQQLPQGTHLIGYSMGGRIALKLALSAPDQFSTITVESADPGSQGKESKTIRQLEQLPYSQFIHQWYQQSLFAGIDQQLMQERTQIHSPQQLIASLRCFSREQQGNLWPHLAPIAHKLTYISGALDTKYVQIGKQLQSLYPQIHHKCIPHKSHNTHWDCNDPYTHYDLKNRSNS